MQIEILETLIMHQYLLNILKIAILNIILIFIYGCSSTHKLATIDDVTFDNKFTRGIHVVDNGESLYVIAFRYGRDFRKLAAVNSIDYPYKIYPGQKIHLNQTTYLRSNIGKNLSKNNKNLNKSSRPNKNISKNSHIKQEDTVDSWVWPVTGKIKTTFKQNNKFNKGIDITVNKTTGVKSAADGIVVYRGTGLKGYGKLIIIKHSDMFLSAYAHNDWLMVNEGQRVKKGQKIASIGKTTKQLHFEIRKLGKPVDPLKFLP